MKYSIVIPTRNRVEYLSYAVRSVLESNRDDVELIVSNNHSSDGTDEFLLGLNDPRLRVVKPSVLLPMAGHYEFALNEARGTWITLLGDDDAVMPYIFDHIDAYEKKFPKIDLIFSKRAYFFWEGCEDLYGNTVVNYQSRKSAQIRSTKRDLDQALIASRSCFDLPQIYTSSIIKKSLYDEIKKNSNGCFYHSIIPDMYSAVALCMSREVYLQTDEPLFWVGTSNKSMSRSDRIYRDAELFNRKNRDEYPCVPTALSQQVSFDLHASDFGSMYIYECIASSPISSRKYNSSRTRLKALVGVMLSLDKRRGTDETQKIKQLVQRECKKYKISPLQLWLMVTIRRPNRLLSRIKHFFLRKIKYYEYEIYSASRDEFQTILDASKAVVAMRFKK